VQDGLGTREAPGSSRGLRAQLTCQHTRRAHLARESRGFATELRGVSKSYFPGVVRVSGFLTTGDSAALAGQGTGSVARGDRTGRHWRAIGAENSATAHRSALLLGRSERLSSGGAWVRRIPTVSFVADRYLGSGISVPRFGL
jgi:hypothetical protein